MKKKFCLNYCSTDGKTHRARMQKRCNRNKIVHFKQSSVLLFTSRTLEFVEDTLNRHKWSLGIVYEILPECTEEWYKHVPERLDKNKRK